MDWINQIRRLIRPVTTVAILVLDFIYMYHPGANYTPGQERLIFFLSVIAVGFWFADRTGQNLIPLINGKNKKGE